ncbi:hypothetical protein BJV85_004032 [Clostridium acetobutylicum]|uniref:Uncharacterized possible metal-binding protein n=1 Tax=Clostridium acetobutylicum (strain ATCC 824 / DSM 792 / JCM 1419 / IAM 19013 / LMG 5710 / NBRC 13948 / NRRL B-527 / VKM B-1787 / 2291 / W) TaxID=272562 RepID=Q97MC2_CLOAB|nr:MULTISPECIES: hypothetical protein [Clostridium]AAK78257.1 Uncharacterized possible metal-binding protein [Clostridium acetobutylicum ATCC 824]ADZ19324.1 Conserved hypothetical protein [Clostridium acetobutylicum EA 2018]AEI31143.1 hypothetical protein SMB_G0282 [Clostridium acetobutylicum DSM 1731]AWV82107.1 hypothetical protein DK921_18930 [Clostridium acetobutylicum]AWV82156.1 hypothetical protein DK921_19240 [Clostridium acetobutylicum]
MSKCKHMNNMRRVLRRYKRRRVNITLQQCGCKELKHVKIKKVCRDVVLVKKHHDKCIYIKICCICTVDPVCDCDCEHDHFDEDCC